MDKLLGFCLIMLVVVWLGGALLLALAGETAEPFLRRFLKASAWPASFVKSFCDPLEGEPDYSDTVHD